MNLAVSMKRAIGSTRFFAIKNGPALLTGAGVAGIGVTCVLVGRAVLKSQPVIQDLRRDTDKLQSREIDANYTERDKAKEMGQLWVRNGLVIAKIYAPAAAACGLTVTAFLAAHGLHVKREAGLLAAYTAMDAGYKAYRERVREILGEEGELNIWRGERQVESVDDEGKPCLITEPNIETYGIDHMPSPYARYFDETNPNWTQTAEWNLTFLISQQNYLNDRLQVNGYLFLNEVYEALGFERTQMGQEVGWKTKDKGGHDGYVDFRIHDIKDEVRRAFVNGYNKYVCIDPNVDGPITID